MFWCLNDVEPCLTCNRCSEIVATISVLLMPVLFGWEAPVLLTESNWVIGDLREGNYPCDYWSLKTVTWDREQRAHVSQLILLRGLQAFYQKKTLIRASGAKRLKRNTPVLEPCWWDPPSGFCNQIQFGWSSGPVYPGLPWTMLAVSVWLFIASFSPS